MIYKSYIAEQNINSITSKLTLFYGENLGLKNDLKNKIKNLNKKELIENITQEELLANEERIFNKLFNNSLFQEKIIFFINQANDKVLEWIKKIEPKLEDQKIFFLSEILDKRSKLRNYFEKSSNLGIIPCYSDNEITLKKIILEKLKGYEGLSNQNLNLIIDNCGLDRSKLYNEIDKIVSFFDNKQINEIKLKSLLNIKINESFDILKDQALIGSKTRTNNLISDTILEPEKNILYLNLINQRLMKLLEVSIIEKDSTLDDAINKIKPPIFWKDKPIFSLQSKKWKKNKIKKMLDQTYDLELKIKSNSSIDKKILIKKLMVDICNLANAS